MALGIFNILNAIEEPTVRIEDETGLIFQASYADFQSICTTLSLAIVTLPPDEYVALQVSSIPFLPSYLLNTDNETVLPSELPLPIEDYLIYFDHVQDMVKLSYDLPAGYFPFDA